jgi:hypothetical protein
MEYLLVVLTFLGGRQTINKINDEMIADSVFKEGPKAQT